MKIELHMIQNFAPACLNRDDTNSPKDCIFGGVRRARISSQCIKRAIRKTFTQDQLLPAENLAVRTQRLVGEVVERLVAQGKDPQTAQVVVEAALGGIGLKAEDGLTQYLLFIGQSSIQEFAKLCTMHWDALAKSASVAKPEAAAAKKTKDAKKQSKEAVTAEVRKALEQVLDGSRAADLALFGRMLADVRNANVDAACQVAHAISTNKIAMEMDYFTAVDDLKKDTDDAGAGMLGVVGYNSACFYRYAVLDTVQLVKNLAGDRDLARRTIEAYLRASASAVPTGKQNTFAAHSRPDMMAAVVRPKGAPLSLANAFVKPATPNHEVDLTEESVNKMVGFWNKVTAVYGDDGCQGHFCGVNPPKDQPKGWTDAGNLDSLIKKVLAAFDKEGKA